MVMILTVTVDVSMMSQTEMMMMMIKNNKQQQEEDEESWLTEKKDGHNLFIFIFTPCITVFDFASHLPFILNTLPKI